MAKATWNRVTPDERCPVCKRGTWCVTSEDGNAVICGRTESGKRCGDAGWLHHIGTGKKWSGVASWRVSAADPPADLTAFAERCSASSEAAARLPGFARSLGLTVESLTAMRVGWHAEKLAWTFPMVAPATGHVVGIRLRKPDGFKFAVAGGKEGLFLPAVPHAGGDPLLVTEGPTDTAALVDMGFTNVVGRPSCTGGIKHVLALVRRRGAKEVVVVSDADEPGRRGAGNLASVLRVYAPAVRVVEPPDGVKDVRAWRNAGATRADLEHIIEAAPVARLAVTSRRISRG